MKSLKCPFLIALFFPGLMLSQEMGMIREKKNVVASDTLSVDSLSLIPGSVTLYSSKGNKIDSSFYKIDHAGGKIIFLKQNRSVDTLSIYYRVFPFLLSKEIKHKDVSWVRPDLYGKHDIFTYDPVKSSSNDIFKTDGLDKSGSIARGVSFGNNQDVIVNSNLNLQLSGKLNNNIDILMSATDNNIPIQPDGNTQQLQEFDKVFIQLSDKRSKLIAGDFQLLSSNSYFMTFNKRAQGLNFGTSFKVDGGKKKNRPGSQAGTNRIMTSGAVSKGKFARNQIQGTERNQGPYKLKGSENESYIIVLSGTEKVYMDGIMLQRGQENDYVIDYNTAEIRFTPKNLITKDKRIIVEFQYSDKNYARSLVQFSDEFEQDKLKLRFNIYSEQDAKNQPLQQQLSPEQKLLLSTLGDSIQYAIAPSIDSIAFTGDLVLYRKKDTTIASILYSDIYEYSTDPDQAFFKLNFSFVGAGKGNYDQINAGVNGKVFQWTAPVSGVKQGSYEPVILLISPKQKQMISLSGEYELSKRSKIGVETAMSNNDVNTFSKINKGNDEGYALKLNYSNSTPLSKTDSSNACDIKTIFNYEFVNKDFSQIERFRITEFERDWNRLNSPFVDDQHILGAGLSLSQNKNASIGYVLSSLIEKENYEGFKHAVSGTYNKHGIRFNGTGSVLNTKTQINSTTFIRSIAEISKKIKWLQIGIREQQENNQFSDQQDSLLANSYKFYEWEAFVNNADTLKTKIGMTYKQRTDFGGKKNDLVKAAYAENIGVTFALLNNPNSEMRTSITYRTLKIVDTVITIQKPDNALISRVEYNLRALKGFITSNTFYEIGSGLEAKREFTYLEVATGQGTYSWIDYNSNQVKELNEFEIAAFKDQANYIRIYTPTNEYIKTYTNEFSEIINLRPSAIWSNKKGFRKLIARFANQTAYRADRKTINNNLEVAYNPFLKETVDSSLIALNSSLRNTIFFNQLSPVFGMDLTYQDNRNKSLLVYGNDSRITTFYESRIRWNMTQKFSLNASYKIGEKYSNSEYTPSRNFQINYTEIEPKVNFQPNTAFRYSLSFRYVEKANTPEYGIQQAIIKDYGTEMKYNILQKGSLNMKANFIQIAYNDVENSSLAFEMLEGLRAGKNITWNISYQRNLSNNTQLSLTYDGRKSETSKTIHTGGVQVRAYF